MVDFITPHQLSPDPVTRYKWTNHSRFPCSDCRHLDGQVRTLQEWLFIRQHPRCRCSLEPVDQIQDGVSTAADSITGQYVSNIDGSKSTIIKTPTDNLLNPDFFHFI